MSNPNTGSREMQKAMGEKIRKLRLQKGGSGSVSLKLTHY